MKKAIIIIMFLFLFSFLLLQVFSQKQNDVVENIEEVEQQFYTIENNKYINEIRLNTITDFEWEKAFLFIPYTSYADIEESLGVKYKISIDQFMGEYYLLIFLNHDKVVNSTLLYFEPKLSIGNKRYLTPTDDLIRIDR